MAAMSRHDFYATGLCWQQPPYEFTGSSVNSYIKYLTKTTDGQTVDLEMAIWYMVQLAALGGIAFIDPLVLVPFLSVLRLIYFPAFVADVYSFYNDFPDGIFDNAEFVFLFNSVTSLGVQEYRKNVGEVFPKSRYPFYFKYVECGHTVVLLIVIAVLLVSQIYELVMLFTVESTIISELVHNKKTWELSQELIAVVIAVAPIILPLAFYLPSFLSKKVIMILFSTIFLLGLRSTCHSLIDENIAADMNNMRLANWVISA
ncbi:unnamed protein product [Angiostrongylus costaricensis]|uniref:Aa_trans domain-containing protein n=1 Tax=Angiostrongylus costaricensis TaxID=334426 RepID=A0A0R3PCU9_ANGCS|nr:unnamed protein product [Angiostrongylus costaricensis]